MHKREIKKDLSSASCKKTEIAYQDHRSHTKNEIKCFPIYRESDLRSRDLKQQKLAEIAKYLQDQHDKLIDSGKQIGDKELDEVEAKLESVLDEYLQYQIEIDEECQTHTTTSSCSSMPKCVWLEQKFSWLKLWATRKGFCISRVKSAILEEQYKEGTEQLTEIVKKIDILEKKRQSKGQKWSIKDKQDLRYLLHLRKELLQTVQEDQSTLKNLAATLVIRDTYLKMVEQCRKEPKTCDSKQSKIYQQTLATLDKKIEHLQQERKARYVKWGVVAVLSFLSLAFYYYFYSHSAETFKAQIAPTPPPTTDSIDQTLENQTNALKSTSQVLDTPNAAQQTVQNEEDRLINEMRAKTDKRILEIQDALKHQKETGEWKLSPSEPRKIPMTALDIEVEKAEAELAAATGTPTPTPSTPTPPSSSAPPTPPLVTPDTKTETTLTTNILGSLSCVGTAVLSQAAQTIGLSIVGAGLALLTPFTGGASSVGTLAFGTAATSAAMAVGGCLFKEIMGRMATQVVTKPV